MCKNQRKIKLKKGRKSQEKYNKKIIKTEEEKNKKITDNSLAKKHTKPK